jgi:diguanylate cyclase (GGDEF)-like protein
MILRCVTYCPLWIKYLFLSLKFALLIASCLIFLAFSVSVIYENKSIPRPVFVLYSIIAFLGISGVTLSAAMLGISDKPEWVKPLCEFIIYFSQFASLVCSLVFAISYHKRLRPRQQVNVYCFTVFNMAATLLQYFLSKVQICGFALSVATLLIYVTLQRPEDALDDISGLFNQKTFTRRVNTLINSGEHFHVFVMEVNNMSIVNSTFGTHGGNDVIREVAARLQKVADKSLYVYRLSGFRFVIVFNTKKQYERFADRYLKMFDQPFKIGETELQLSATACVIAVPEITDKAAEFEDLIKYYRASANYSDKIIIADKESIDNARRRELVDYAIQSALTNHNFDVYYQPIYSVKDKCFNGCEALIRLKDPNLGFIPPDEFIPIAEQNGRIVEVGKYVIDEVCRFLTEYKPEQYGIEFVDVNLSVIQCMHPEIISDIEQTLKKYNIPRERICLEVTETASAKSYALLQSCLNELHSNGFTISLDDFGTGFSSVEYLINFPFDVVKLDKSLVWAYMSTKKYEPILQHYMPMLHGLGTKIVAEGVETIQMVDALDALGCDYLQGYYYSRPIPKAAFIEFLKANYDVQTA